MGDTMDWFAGNGKDPEWYELGPYATEEQAVVAGLSEFGSDFTVALGTTVAADVPDAYTFINEYIVLNEELSNEYEEFGENLIATTEQRQELTDGLKDLFNGWLAKHNLTPDVRIFEFSEERHYE